MNKPLSLDDPALHENIKVLFSYKVLQQSAVIVVWMVTVSHNMSLTSFHTSVNAKQTTSPEKW